MGNEYNIMYLYILYKVYLLPTSGGFKGGNKINTPLELCI